MHEDVRAHAHGSVLPTALIKARVKSEVAAMKSQPRAHLFKRENNEFFVASHLPITINLAFCRYLHSDPYCMALQTVALHMQMLHPQQISCLQHRGC